MAVQIQFRRGTVSEWATANPILAEAEMGIETGTNLFKVGDGTTRWNDLPYGGIQGADGPAGYTGSIGNMAVDNVLYVSKSGDDANDGLSLTSSKLTIKAALAVATYGATIFVKSGDYTEDNPMLVPPHVSIVGDNLRTVTVRPLNLEQDIFYVNNGTYLAHMSFKDHLAPSAAVAFPADGTAGVIIMSPYVQNCTSITTTGTGMRIDGDLALGTKSMVADAFTQYNQGGVGIHLLNRGYAQLVSVFTIACDKGFLAESGGFCSITNSNSSFGNYALYADGVSSPIQTATVSSSSRRSVVMSNLTERPTIGNALKFSSTTTYYTVNSSTELSIGNFPIVNPTISNEDAEFRNARQAILNRKTRIQVDTITFLNKTYPNFQFNQFKCNRDIATILNAVAYDICLGTYYQSTIAGIAYTRASAMAIEEGQKTETLAAINFVLNAVHGVLTPSSTSYIRSSTAFGIIIDIITNGVSAIPTIDFPAPSVVDTNVVNARDQIQANKEFITAEALEYLRDNFLTFTYDKAKCARDTGLIVDSLLTDLAFPSNGYTQSNFAGLQYWNQTVYVGEVGDEITTTTNAITVLRDLAKKIVVADTTGTRYQSTVTQNVSLPSASVTEVTAVGADVDVVLDILTNGTEFITDEIVSPGFTPVSANAQKAADLLQANKTYLQAEVIGYINSTYPTFTYNQATCYRDVGYIIDCISFDVLYGGNRQATQAGVYYYGFSTTSSPIANERVQTTLAYDRIRDILPSLVTNLAIEKTEGNTGTQNVSYDAASLVEASAMQSMIDKITTIINDGPSAADTKTPIGLTKSTSTNVSKAIAIIEANKEFIKSEIIAWVDANVNVEFTYDKDKCARDTGLIVDALAQDILFSTSSQSTFAGLQYWSQGTYTGDIGNQLVPTVNAIEYVKALAHDIVISDTTGTRYQSAVTQTISSSTAATTSTIGLIESGFDTILDLLNNGVSGVTDAIIPNGLIVTTSSNITHAVEILQTNKAYLQAEVIAYVEATKPPNFLYDQSLCARDVGFMLDSICFDITYGGNKQAIQSGVAYYGYISTSSVIATDLPQTVAAYNFINSLTQQIVLGRRVTQSYQGSVLQVRNLSTATVAEGAIATTLISTITNIIQNGPSVAAPLRPIPLTRSTDTHVVNAAKLLHANRSFIQAEVIAYIDATTRSLDQVTCARDINYILDAVTYDLLYNGNSQVSVAGAAYYNGTLLTVEKEIDQVLATYEFINSLTQKVVVGESVTPLQLVVTQDVSNPAATASEAIKVDELFTVIDDILVHGYTSTIYLEETIRGTILPTTTATLHQYSLIVSTGHSFEWIGAGTDINSALPYLGGQPIATNQGYEVNGGKVNFTGTDERGDFKIGNDLVINRNNGTISGRTFTKSLFAVMTPYILSIGS